MDKQQISAAVAHLKAQRIAFEQGLSDAEVTKIEGVYGFRFPEDLRLFLQTALPVSGGFPNWRSGAESTLRLRFLDCPWDGIVFDIEHNDFWPEAWGSKPRRFEEAVEEAKRRFAGVPPLIPVRSHHYLPALPSNNSNPLFSIRQTDISVVSSNLLAYLENTANASQDSTASVPFWSALAKQSHVTVPNLSARHDGQLEEYERLLQAATAAGYWAKIIPLLNGTGVSFRRHPPEDDDRLPAFWITRRTFGWLLCITCPRFVYVPQASRVAELCLTLLDQLPEDRKRQRLPFWKYLLNDDIRRGFDLVMIQTDARHDEREARLKALEKLGWREMSDGQHDVTWDRYKKLFGYPAGDDFCTPDNSITWDISSSYLRGQDFLSQMETDLTLKSLAALQECTKPGEELLALDWNHTCYFFDPHGGISDDNSDSWAIPVLPNGDHYTFLAQDFRFGMIGNCVDQTLCVFGRQLLDAFAIRQPLLFRKSARTSEERRTLQEKCERLGWTKLSVDERDDLWERFDERFNFYEQRGKVGCPGIREPTPSVTWSISDTFAAQRIAFAEIENELRIKIVKALCVVMKTDERLIALDSLRWYEHYSFFPHRLVGASRESWPFAVLPKDNYTIIVAPDMSFGVFGNPLERTVCIFGQELLAAIERDVPSCLERQLRKDGG